MTSWTVRGLGTGGDVTVGVAIGEFVVGLETEVLIALEGCMGLVLVKVEGFAVTGETW